VVYDGGEEVGIDFNLPALEPGKDASGRLDHRIPPSVLVLMEDQDDDAPFDGRKGASWRLGLGPGPERQTYQVTRLYGLLNAHDPSTASAPSW
jgi:hypothetical protein